MEASHSTVVIVYDVTGIRSNSSSGSSIVISSIAGESYRNMSESGAGAPPTTAEGTSGGVEKQKDSERSGNRGNRFSKELVQRPPVKKFAGKEEGLGDEYVYQHTNGREASDQYAVTTEEIIRYIATKYRDGGADVERSLSDGMKLVIGVPTAPVGDDPLLPATEGEMIVWKMQVSIVLRRIARLDSNLEGVYQLFKGQCSKPILEKVESQQAYATVHQGRDPIGLLKLIKAVMFNYNSKRYRAVALIEVIGVGLVFQSKYATASEYLEKFRTQLDVLRSAGGEISLHPGMVLDELERAGAGDPPSEVEAATANRNARQRFEGALFLLKSDQSKYGRLVQELANDYNKGRDSYPSTLSDAYELMLHDVRDQDSRVQTHGVSGVTFINNGDARVPASDTQPNPRPGVKCFRCAKFGHLKHRCLEVTDANGTALRTVVDESSKDDAVGEAVALTTFGETGDEAVDNDDDYIDEFCF